MAICDLTDLPVAGPLLGLDPGAKTIGLAGCDAGRLIASPVETLAKGRKLAPVLEYLLSIYDERGAVGLVIGLPLNMDGSEGPRVQSAKALAHNILKAREVPIAFFDERLSSAQAERAMLEADLSRARRAELIDASAAAVILQTAIDRLANTQG
ncbi:MAG: Holliday junction resolvase RuvX [Pseudomonadota bacterium]